MKTSRLLVLAVSALWLASANLAAEAIPQYVAWKAVLANGREVSFVSVVGLPVEPSRITLDGRTVAIGVELPDPNSQTVIFRLLEVKTVKGAGEIINQREKFSVQPGAKYTTAWQPSITFRVDKVSPGESGDKEADSANATTGPVTDDLVAWEVFHLSSGPFRLTNRGGELARIDSKGASFGIVGKVESKDSVRVRVFDIKRVPGAGDVLRQRDSFLLTTGDERPVQVQPAFTLKLSSVTLAQK